MEIGELFAVPSCRERWRTFHVKITALNDKLDQQLCPAFLEHCFATYLSICACDLVAWLELLASRRATCAQSIPSIDSTACTNLLDDKFGIKRLKELEVDAPAHT